MIPAATQSDSPKLLISVETLATMLDLSERTVWRMLSAGQIPITQIRLGRRVMFRRADVEAWVRGGCSRLREATQ